MPDPTVATPAVCQTCGRDDRECGVLTEVVGRFTRSSWVCRAGAVAEYAIQVWEHSPGRWITVETEDSKDAALDVGVRLAPIEPDVRVTERGVSIARWLMGARTVA